MRLKEVRVTNFRNILDSNSVPIEKDITSLVGKNESGKTAFLRAIYMLNPAYSVGTDFLAQQHYPAWLEKKHRMAGIELDNVEPIKVSFEVDEGDIVAIESLFGKGSLKSKQISVSRRYDGTLVLAFESDERKAIEHFLSQFELPKGTSKAVHAFSDIETLATTLSQGEDANPQLATQLRSLLKETLKGKEFSDAMSDALADLLPLFFYYDDYSALSGTVKIKEILEKKKDDLKNNERTARALLEMAGADKEYLLDPDYETRKRELENVANSISSDVLEYWSTNTELRVHIEIVQKTVTVGNGHQAVLDELKIRLWDDRHLLSLPFDERSSGFRWFFSFLAAFSEFEHGDRKVIILLDEPGLGLHARAQKDFLRFIEERLSKKCQVIYSTHSPFMIQPDKLHQVRLVEDKGREHGSQVTSDVFGTDSDTLFPLQGALGYDLAQHLFVAPHNLVVEGAADYTYLFLISDFLHAAGREGLDPRWSIIPVGGADLVPSFVALLGNHLQVTVLLDSRKEGNQRLMRLADQKILDRSRIITIGEILGTKLGDIEDLFEIPEYLELYATAFGTAPKPEDLVGTDPIVTRIARFLGVERFDHGKPADALLRTREAFLKKLSTSTLDRFEMLFRRVNSTFGKTN